MTKAKRYKRYSSEFKREAIQRASEEGVTDKAVCDELGIGRELQARDLRRTAAVRLAEASCTPIEIAAITGHSIERTRQILETYVPRTDPMGRNAVAKWERNEPGNV